MEEDVTKTKQENAPGTGGGEGGREGGRGGGEEEGHPGIRGLGAITTTQPFAHFLSVRSSLRPAPLWIDRLCQWNFAAGAGRPNETDQRT
jgi:hypothetical protein